MNRTPVVSSNIRSVGYDPSSLTLEVEFSHGGIYHYLNVPERLHLGLMNAPSKGKYLYANISSRSLEQPFEYRRIFSGT